MAKVAYKYYSPNDNLLFPTCIGDFLPQNHSARVVSTIIDKLDISEIESDYKGGGIVHPRTSVAGGARRRQVPRSGTLTP